MLWRSERKDIGFPFNHFVFKIYAILNIAKKIHTQQAVETDWRALMGYDR